MKRKYEKNIYVYLIIAIITAFAEIWVNGKTKECKNTYEEFLACFSSFGKMSYVPKENRIISQYGNHGYYHEIYSKIEDGIYETLPEVTEEYRISEDEYESLTGELNKGSLRIVYDEMQRL